MVKKTTKSNVETKKIVAKKVAAKKVTARRAAKHTAPATKTVKKIARKRVLKKQATPGSVAKVQGSIIGASVAAPRPLAMQYVNFVYEDSDDPKLYTGPVPESDAAYLRHATRYLKPLSDEEYMTGPAGILHTFAKYSYVLEGPDLYWCVEWPPGFLLVRMTPDKELQWVTLRSPIPNFGGREPLPDDGDPDEYDYGDNPQYNLILNPWDAQYDKRDREWRAFVPADSEVQQRFEQALARVNSLGDTMQTRYSADSRSWAEQCKQNLQTWCGEGIRLKPVP